MTTGLKKFISINFWRQIFQVFLTTCPRFPLTMLSLIIFTLLALIKNHHFDLLTDLQWRRGILIAATGAFWFLAAGLFSERNDWSGIKKYCLALPVFAIIVWQISSNDSLTVSSWTLLLAVVLAVTFAAYIFRKNGNASFWYFNFQLASGIYFSVLTTLILCVGLSLILKSIEYLFKVYIDHKFYVDIWLICWCFYTPVYFLANVPTQFDYQRSDCEFPRAIHFIQNYVLVPLSLVFMMILYAYFIKIILQWELPRGNLGKMISVFGVIGIFTHLTIYPVYDRGVPLLNWFYRNFYSMMIVPLGLLALAITVRLSQYGLTEPRYIVVICVIWFALLIVYFLMSGTNFQLRNVVIALAMLSLIASFGPWRIDKLPVQHQFARLQELLIKNKLLVDEQYISPKVQPDIQTTRSIISIVQYLSSHGGSETMRSWFSDQAAFDKAIDCHGRRCKHYSGLHLMKLMGIEFEDQWQNTEKNSYFDIRINYLKKQKKYGAFGNYNKKISVKGFDYMIPISAHHINYCGEECDDLVDQTISTDDNRLEIRSNDFPTVSFDLNRLLTQFQERRTIQLSPEDAHKLVLNRTMDGVTFSLMIDHITGVIEDNNKQIKSVDALLLLKLNTEK